MALMYPPFAASDRIVRAAQSSPPMQKRESGPGVALLQAALFDLGYKMPVSFAKGGKPDGVYGDETYAAVLKFQTVQKLRRDGIAGMKTFERLDQQMIAKSGPPAMPSPPVLAPPAPPAIPPSRDYMIGTADPFIKPDPGSGMWGAKPVEFTYVMLKNQLIDPKFLGSATLIIGDDAVGHLQHYFSNAGTPYTIDLEGMINEVPTARKMFELEVEQAVSFIEMLPPGVHYLTSTRAESSYNYKGESRNWYYAVGGYSVWGKGKATVTTGPGGTDYVLDFEYKFFDRYNWDKGKKVTVLGVTVTDEFMGEFHKQGLAQEYDEVGSIRRRFTWKHGDSIPPHQFKASGAP